MKALIQAGGAGTRLKSITGDLPKPMVKIGGKPILLHQIENLAANGIKDLIIVVSKKTTAVQDFFGDGSDYGVHISYIVEQEPLGSAGALYYAKDFIDSDFILLFGDLLLSIDWKRFIAFHEEHHSLITTFAHPNGHPQDSDLLVCNENSKVIGLLPKDEPRSAYFENLTNAGLYIVGHDILDTFEAPEKLDFEKEILAPSISEGLVYAYRSSEYVKDCGTTVRYAAATFDLNNGIVEARNLSHPQRVLFLDRDGTINHFGDFVTKPDMLTLEPGAAEAIRVINGSPYLAICVTNQPVVARGETTIEGLKIIHNKMETLLGAEGAYLNDLFFCPHYPIGGFAGENEEYKIVCDCRKPKIGLLLQAQKRYNIDLKNSWMIGDTCQDIQTGINAGCHTCLLTMGDPHPYKKYADAKPEMICSNLLEAVNKILSL